VKACRRGRHLEISGRVIGGLGEIDFVRISGDKFQAGPFRKGQTTVIEAIPPNVCYFYSWIPFIPKDTIQPTSNKVLRLITSRNGSVVAVLLVEGETPPTSTMLAASPGMAFLQVMTYPFGAGNIRVSVNREPVESEFLTGLPQLLVMAEPGSLVYVKAIPVGCQRLVGWRGSDYAVKP